MALPFVTLIALNDRSVYFHRACERRPIRGVCAFLNEFLAERELQREGNSTQRERSANWGNEIRGLFVPARASLRRNYALEHSVRCVDKLCMRADGTCRVSRVRSRPARLVICTGLIEFPVSDRCNAIRSPSRSLVVRQLY